MTNSVTETHLAAAPKILILGATGPTGRHIVSRAVSRGYDITVLVRSPEKATDLKGAKLVIGDARDEKALRQASGTAISIGPSSVLRSSTTSLGVTQSGL